VSRILVVDDNPAMLEHFESSLRAAGQVVISARSAKTALAFHEDAPADLIIADIFMPEESGLRAKGDRVKILAVTGLGMLGDVLHQARNLGADATIEKPFDTLELVRTVQNLLHANG
jgi:DNA-binding response OmpR family regulator